MDEHKKKNYKQKGSGTGTSGSFTTLVDDIGALVDSVVDTVVDSIELVVDVLEIPSDLGTAFKESGAPGADLS